MISQEELNDLRPGDELVVKDTSNGKELKAWFRMRTKHMLFLFIERFNDTMRFQDDGKTGLGRFIIDRKVGL